MLSTASRTRTMSSSSPRSGCSRPGLSRYSGQGCLAAALPSCAQAILSFDLAKEFAITPAGVKAGSDDVLEPGAAYDR